MVVMTRLTIIKLVELVLVCVLLGLHYHTFPTPIDDQFVIQTTFGGYLIILVGLFAGGVMATPVNRRVDLFFSLVGCALFIAAGALIIDRNQSGSGELHDKYMAKGSISIIEGAIFLLDAFFTFRGEA